MSELTGRLPPPLRALLRRPGYSMAAIFTLAIGIGATTSIVSILRGTVLRPLPYGDPGRLIVIRDYRIDGSATGQMSVPNYLDLRERARSLQSFMAWRPGSVNLAAEGMPVRVRWLQVTAGFLQGIGVAPELGRGFREGEDGVGAAPVVILSHRLWRDRFGGTPDAIGRSLRLDGRLYTIVGVLPASFWFPGEPRVIAPFQWDEQDLHANRGWRRVEGLARLRPGATTEVARDELGRNFRVLADEYPNSNAGWSVQVTPAGQWMLGDTRSSLPLLLGAVLLILLIGCVNVANLMLVRAERRSHEFALRVALGASRARVLGSFVIEGLILSGLAGLLGIALGWVGMRTLLALFGDAWPRASEVHLDLTVFAFAVGLALLTGLVVGLAPGLWLDARRVQGTLRRGSRRISSGGRLQKGLVVVEVVLAVVLVTGSGLLLNSFWRVSHVDTGVDPDRAFTFALELPSVTYSSPEQTARFYREAVRTVRSIPGVTHVGITDRGLMTGGYNITSLASPDDPDLKASFVEIRQVTPDFFAAAGIPLLAGRGFTEEDGPRRSNVVVISETLARALFPRGDAIGKRIHPQQAADGYYEVVGIVGSVREFGVTEGKRPAVYWPYPVANAVRAMTFVVRTTAAPLLEVPPVRRAIARLDPTLPIYRIKTLKEAALDTVGNRRAATAVISSFGALALALAGLGIFAVLAFSVQQRTREMGIRMALGATGGGVTRTIVGQGVRLVTVGLVPGIVIALFACRLLTRFLYHVQPTDATTLALVAMAIIVTGAAASYMPARRAARIEPMEALREE